MQVVELAVAVDTVEDLPEVEVRLGSLHPPNQPGWAHEGVDEGVVMVGTGVAVGTVNVAVVVTSSLQPNQPGWFESVTFFSARIVKLTVLQVEVDVAVVEEVEVVGPLVVLSSKHPHQPGVLHVSVRVLVEVAVEVMLRDVVEDSVPLLSKNSQG